MAKDYKRAPDRGAQRAPGSWMSFLTGLGIGLVCALVVYLWVLPSSAPTGGSAPGSGPAQVVPPAQPPEPPVALEEEAPPPVSGAEEQLALPKFDFYKILPEIEVKVPEEELSAAQEAPAEAAEEDQPPTKDAPAVAEAAYMLQVASFQSFSDADQSKAQLALQGVQATIQRVVINGQDIWYRVHVGPYRQLIEAQQMRTRLSQLGVTAIVLKLGGGTD